jgi:hypothetical protein
MKIGHPSDVRKVITGFPRDEVLALKFPETCTHDPDLPGLRIEAGVLLGYGELLSLRSLH